MAVRHDAISHRLTEDNARMRDALHLIVEMCAAQPDNDMTRHIARIARNALVSAAPENKSLRVGDEHDRSASVT
ncbi:hypothetical protein AWB78_07808 [Caballeronia calidae]|uniref:Uncharacterized protein n=2 Tax=Caballeronia calidae TaxID=1777139 RepID=A0A158EGQ5_9BURK|nr:hypothetical protein AWB78_07808 [Caballeronia calidae]